MSRRTPNYAIVERGDSLVLKDLGPWDRYPTITNDAESVVERLLSTGDLAPEQRLFYFDSDGHLDEILVKDGRFAGFAPGPNPHDLASERAALLHDMEVEDRLGGIGAEVEP